jgi:uncharacterized repeat protein (TIGR03833 family)
MKSIPNIQQVVPGAPVSIVLKVDQPTGNEVQGIVGELLTRGDHPRGIKVRLQDGRVGRVQRIVSQETAMAGFAGLSGSGRNGEMGAESNVGVKTTSGSIRGFSGRRYGDFRTDEPDEPLNAGLSLADYVVTKAKGKGRQKKQNALGPEGDLGEDEDTNIPSDDPVTSSKCPVCGEFEGDEAAVAHHVNGHFE